MSFLFDKLKTSDNKMDDYSKIMTYLQREKKILGCAYLQLTPFCNLSCKMCYARMTAQDVQQSGHHIMRFDEWKWYIDSLSGMGTTILDLTGGECLLHPDFEKIYNYAYDSGFEIILFTNGTCISPELFELFCEKPPNSFSVTVYGGSPETYQRLCGNGEAYDKVYSNIDTMRSKGFRVLVKYTVTNENIDDLPQVYAYFKERGLRLRYQNTLMQFNKADCDSISKLSVDEDRLKNAEQRIFKDTNIANTDDQDKLFVKIMRENRGLPDKGIQCSAGRNICHIRWDGMMTPCVSFEAIGEDPRLIGFDEAWKRMNQWADEFPIIEECKRCPHVVRCPQCVSLHYNDTHVSGTPSPRLCWKRNHPEEAEAIEKRLIEKGLISPEEIYAEEG